jgi:O-antigen ligase
LRLYIFFQEKLLKLSKIIFNLTGTALFFVPLAYEKFSYNWYDFPKTMLLFVLGALLVFLSALDKENYDRPGPMPRLICAYLVWLAVTVFLSKSPHVNFFGIYLRFQGLFFFIFSIYFFFLGRRFGKATGCLILPLALAGIIISAVAVCEFWNGADRSGSTQGNAVLLANYLVLILPCLLGLVFQSSGKWSRGFWLLGFYLTLLGLHFTFSRAGWAGLMVILIVFWLIQPNIIKQQPKLAALIGLILILSVATTVILLQVQPGKVILKNPARLEQIQKSPVVDQPRMTMIGVAWRIFWDHRLTGIGINSLPVTATRYLPAWLARNNPTLLWDQIHNDFFHTLATQGLGGGIFYVTLLILLFRRWRQWWKSKEKEPLAAGIWAAIAGHLLVLQFSFPAAGYSLIFWFLIGVGEGTAPMAVSPSPLQPLQNQLMMRMMRTVKISGAFLLLVATLYFVIGYVRADLAYMAGQKALERKDYYQNERYLQKAIAWAPWEDHYRFKRADNLYFMLKTNRIQPERIRKCNSRLIAELATLIEHNPNHFLYYNLIAKTYEMYGMEKQAAQYLRQVVDLYPNYYPGYAALGDSMLKTGRKSEAIRYYRQALRINPDYEAVKSRLQKLDANEK